ncbi:MAG: DUF5666 domain-containing protein [Candidatus Binatia bacterium]
MTQSKTSTIVGRITTLAMAVLLASSVAWAGLVGVVTAVSKSSVTVSGATYDIGENTEIQDMAGHPITLPELRPGVNVELEFDEEGGLATIKAAVVR